MTRIRLPVLAATASAVLLAGCGGASPVWLETAASTRGDRGMIEFAHCVRAHGISMADPYHRPGHAGLSIELPGQGPATADAYKACSQFLKPVIELKQAAAQQQITPAVRLGLIRYAECMRGYAVPMLDPNALGQLNLGDVPGISDGFGRYTPQFHTADHDCRHLLPSSVPDNGTGP
jgi:hypothetical protein